MTKLTRDVPREVTIQSLEDSGAVIVTMTKEGISLRGKGTSRELFASYADIAAVAKAPKEMPSKYKRDKIGWLHERTYKKPPAVVDDPTQC